MKNDCEVYRAAIQPAASDNSEVSDEILEHPNICADCDQWLAARSAGVEEWFRQNMGLVKKICFLSDLVELQKRQPLAVVLRKGSC